MEIVKNFDGVWKIEDNGSIDQISILPPSSIIPGHPSTYSQLYHGLSFSPNDIDPNDSTKGSNVVRVDLSGYDGTVLKSITEFTYETFYAYDILLLPFVSLIVEYPIPTSTSTRQLVQNPFLFIPDLQYITYPSDNNSWITWNLLKGKWWLNSGSSSGNRFTSDNDPNFSDNFMLWNEFINLYPEAKISFLDDTNRPGLYGSGIRLEAGGGNMTWSEVTLADNFTIGVNGNPSKTYHFML